jgi:hypothetical protein
VLAFSVLHGKMDMEAARAASAAKTVTDHG